MPEPSVRPRLVLAIIAAAALIALTSARLDVQGLHYDEVHQATAAFAYVGQPAPMFNVAQVLGLPALTMNYSGAIKTGVYGAYLRGTGASFTASSWRWLGILVAASGLAVFCLLARGAPLLTTGIVALLVVTDVNLLVSVRHDWGPVVVSLALRLILLAVYLRRGTEGPGPREALGIGVLCGVIVFDKLSGAVLVPPVVMLLLLTGSGARWARMRSFGLGLAVGLLPLIFLNARSLMASGHLISLGNVPEKLDLPLERLAVRYLRLAAGGFIQNLILGRPATWAPWFEGYALLAALVGTAVAAIRAKVPATRMILGFMAAWILVGLQMPLLPSTTSVHHWILGTPFHYAALGVAFGDLKVRRAAWGWVWSACLLVLVAGRVPSVIAMERHLLEGAASADFDPALTRLGQLAAREPDDVMFVATTWGVATQIVCFSNGRPDRVVESFWRDDPENQVSRLLERHPRLRVFYLVAWNKPTGAPNRREAVEAHFAASRDVREDTVPAPLLALTSLSIRRFVVQ